MRLLGAAYLLISMRMQQGGSREMVVRNALHSSYITVTHGSRMTACMALAL